MRHAGVLYALPVRVRTPSSPVREREREREREKENEKITGALPHFSYLVNIIITHAD